MRGHSYEFEGVFLPHVPFYANQTFFHMKRSYSKIRFEKEAKDNSEMACSNLHCFYITALRD